MYFEGLYSASKIEETRPSEDHVGGMIEALGGEVLSTKDQHVNGVPDNADLPAIGGYSPRSY